MKSNGCDKINVLKAAETFSPGDVPQSDSFIHGGGEQEKVLEEDEETMEDDIKVTPVARKSTKSDEQKSRRCLTLDQDRSNRSAV